VSYLEWDPFGSPLFAEKLSLLVRLTDSVMASYSVDSDYVT